MRMIMVSTMAAVTVLMLAMGCTAADPTSLRHHRRASDATNATIAGGAVQTTRIPYFVAFSDYRCSGTLITGDMVLTAAHCVRGGSNIGFPYFVTIGPLTRTDSAPLIVEVDIDDSVVHPSWQGDFTKGYDVVVLKLNTLVDTKVYPPVTLNSDCNQPCQGAVLKVFGLGRTSNGGDVSPSLKALDTTHQCGSTNEYINLYAGPSTGGCAGDSGGPAVIGTTQYGIASFVRGGCASGNHDGYMRVSTYYGWIQEQVCKKATDKNKFSCTTFSNLQSAARDGLTDIVGGARWVRNAFLGIGKDDDVEMFPMGPDVPS